MLQYLEKVKSNLLTKQTIETNANPLVSVITPLYNQGQYLQDAILSVIEQNYKNWEMVIVDDCSTDDSFHIAQTLVQKYPHYPIHLYQNAKNSKAGVTRNVAFRHSKGNYIVPLDADDKLAPDFIQKTIAAMQASGADIVYTDVQEFGESDNLVPSIDFNPIILLLFNYITITSLMKRSVLEKVGGYDETLSYSAEDYNLWLSAIENGFTAKHIPEPLFYYRKRSGSVFDVMSKEKDLQRKAELIMRHKQMYLPEQIEWAELVLADNPEHTKLQTKPNIMPIIDTFDATYNRLLKKLQSLMFE
jgi:glycosyltransferase involved in cell wall biosynthesis